jgi:hypothetical protein
MLGWAVMVNALRWPATEQLRASKHPPDPLPFRQPREDQGCVEGVPRVEMRYRARTHLHSLHCNALVTTSMAIPARFSTGPGEVAQSVEHAAENRGVGGSIPPLPTDRPACESKNSGSAEHETFTSGSDPPPESADMKWIPA